MGKVTREDLDLETGLADDFDGWIVDASFDYPAEEYTAIAGTSDPGLVLTLESPELERSIEQFYSCGGAKQWEVGKSGKEVTSAVRPESRRFNMNSRAGTAVGRMFSLVGGGDKVKGQDFFLKRDHYMTEADFYVGLGFHWKRESMATVSGDKRDVLMPATYLGVKEITATPGKGKGGAPAEAEVVSLDNETIAALVEMASGKTDKELKAALVKDPEMKKNVALMTAVFSKGLLDQLEAEDKLTKDPSGTYI